MIDSSPGAYARHLATYIAQPDKIRTLTLRFFGRAPSLATCARYRVESEGKGNRDAKRMPKFMGPWPCKHDRIDANIRIDAKGLDRCTICEAKALARAKEQRRIEAEAAAIRKRKLEFRRHLEARRELVAAGQYEASQIATLPAEVIQRKREAARLFGIPVVDIDSKKRDAALLARSALIRVWRRQGYSFPRIAICLSYDCHSSVIHLHKTFDQRAKKFPFLLEAVEALQ